MNLHVDMDPTTDFARNFTSRFDPISLNQLNARAAMLERLDNKYIVSRGVLEEATEPLAAEFDVLDIGGVRSFAYDTCYFDDADLRSYYDHHQGRRQRCKVRVRTYRDAGLSFVEVKLKDKRNVTIKRRLPYEGDLFEALDDSALAHVDGSYRGLYGKAFEAELRPVIEMSYRRMTLVAKEGGERMTIDSDIVFRADGQVCEVSPELFVVETKSVRGNGLADKVLRVLHGHPVQACSKYCVGMAALEKVSLINRFLPAMRRLGIMPVRAHDAQRLSAQMPLVAGLAPVLEAGM